MGSSRARWRVTWLGALCALCLVLGVFGGTASATLGLDQSTDTSLPIDGDSHWFNQNSMVTSGAYQYFTYWDAIDTRTGLVYLKVTRRRLSDDTLESIRLDGVDGNVSVALDNANDGHNTVMLGLSPIDGRLHMSFSAHVKPHHYIQSSAGCMTQTTFSGRTCTFTAPATQVSGSTTEDRLTYPKYFNDNNGKLFMSYRDGLNYSGDEYLNAYNDDGTWRSLGVVMHGQDAGQNWDGDGAGPLATSSRRGPYVDSWRFDRNNRLHVMWNWREDDRNFADEWGVREHDLYYAYSDNGGTVWYDTNGRQVADLSRGDPIDVLDSSTLVLSEPGGYWLGAGDMVLDSNNQPHVAIPISDVQTTDPKLAHMRQAHFWRTTDGRWYESYIEPSGDGRQNSFAGGLVFDQADNAYYVFGQYNRDWRPWNSVELIPRELPYDNVTIQDDGTEKYLNIIPYSATTAIDTEDYIGVPISTASGARNYRNITVRLKNETDARSFVVYWTTDASPRPTVDMSQTFAITANDTSFKTYTFTITDADWRGTLRSMELDPVGLTDVSGTGRVMKIDYVHVDDDQRSPNTGKAWEFNSGMEVKAAEAGVSGNWATWNIEPLLPEVNDSVNDGGYNVDQDRYKASHKVDFMVTEQGAPGTESSVLHEFTISGDNLIKNWGFEVDTQGWYMGTDISGFGWVNDGGVRAVGGTITGRDPAIVSADNLSVPIGSSNTIVVRMKNSTSATRAKIYFATDASTGFNETKSKSFAITASSGYTNYSIDMTGVSGWTSRDVLRRLRLDPVDDGTTTSGSFKVDRIYIWP